MSLPFLDMLIKRNGTKLSSEWYTKPTDTGFRIITHWTRPNSKGHLCQAWFIEYIDRAVHEKVFTLVWKRQRAFFETISTQGSSSNK